MIWQIIHVVEIFLWLLLTASGAYILFFALVSLLWKKPVSHLSAYLTDKVMSLRHDKYYTYLILYPAYNEDRVIVTSVETFLTQYYPYDSFQLVVISDHMQGETNEKLSQHPITLLQPVFEKSSKAKAMQYAIQQLEAGGRTVKHDFDFVVILDADNVVNPDFLEKLNEVCAKGYKAIQCHRCAKNSNNDIAVLDGVSEEINNTIFRKAHNRLGLSSALIGSGMCFDYKLFQKNVFQLSTAGEDREMEALLLKHKVFIKYAAEIHVFDEKVSNQDNFQRQRMRWMTAQVQSLLRQLPQIPNAFLHGNLNFIDKTIQQALIPRSILIVLLSAISVLMTIIVPEWCGKWWFLLIILAISLYIALPEQLRSRSLFGKVLAIPGLVLRMLENLLHMDHKNTDFLHTTHDK